MIGSKVLKKRWILGFIFGCSLLYFVKTIVYQNSHSLTQDDYIVRRRPLLPDLIKWKTKTNSTALKTCRNSVQGKTLVADERGYICERSSILSGGCCDIEAKNTKQYSCESCHSNGCCNTYENCVSCCLHPEKQPLLRKILSKAADSFSHLFASVTDQFELCLAKCRTSSQSVQHENTYRDPVAKFCYGESPPDIIHGVSAV